MGTTFRLLLLAAFVWVGIVLFSEASSQARLETPDKGKVLMLFLGAAADGLCVAVIVALLVVPAVGDAIGSYFFNPKIELEKDAHAAAIARLAQGDPEGAIEDYEAILAKDPADTLAISEISKICCRDLGDTARGAAVLEKALSREWTHEQSSFLANRLADVYLLQEDPLRAREILIQVAETMDGTKYAANARHRIREIERTAEAGTRSSALIPEAEQLPEGEPAARPGEIPREDTGSA